MAGIIPQSSLQGGIFELVARGRKDTYFVTDSETSVLPFNSRYESSTPYLKERRTTVPLNAPQFGNTFEVELDKYGDVLLGCTLLIDLPTWLPPLPVTSITGVQVAPPQQANSAYWIKDASGYSYGYTKLIGYFLFERIQLYQDSVLLQEWSGDGLFAARASEGSWNSGYLDYQFLGGNDIQTAPPSRSIALRATPGRLRLSLPLPGLQGPADGGLPLCALPAQSFRLRIKLRSLEDLVETSAPGDLKPVPWDPAKTYTYTPPGGAPYSFKPIDRSAIGQPTILLETVQAYVDADTQHALQNNRKAIPFRRMFENVFTMGDLDYKPLDHGGVAQVTRRLDGRHPTERIVWFFRNFNALCANKYTDLVNGRAPNGQFYSQMKLVIAGRDREQEWEPEIWQDVENYAKDEIDTGYNIGEMRWTLGDQYELQRPYTRVPDGTVNFTTADRPTLHINLANIFPEIASAQRKAEMRVITEGWAIYEIAEGRGRLMFAN